MRCQIHHLEILDSRKKRADTIKVVLSRTLTKMCMRRFSISAYILLIENYSLHQNREKTRVTIGNRSNRLFVSCRVEALKRIRILL